MFYSKEIDGLEKWIRFVRTKIVHRKSSNVTTEIPRGHSRWVFRVFPGLPSNKPWFQTDFIRLGWKKQNRELEIEIQKFRCQKESNKSLLKNKSDEIFCLRSQNSKLEDLLKRCEEQITKVRFSSVRLCSSKSWTVQHCFISFSCLQLKMLEMQTNA